MNSFTTLSCLLAIFLAILAPLSAQPPATQPPSSEARILGKLADGTPAPPAPPKPSFVVPTARIQHAESFREAGRNVTLQRIAPIALPPPPAPVESPSLIDPATFRRKCEEYRAAHLREHFIGIGATVWRGQGHATRTHLTYRPPGGDKTYSMWSSADFSLLAGLGSFADAEGAIWHMFLMWSPVDIDTTNDKRASHGRPPLAFPATLPLPSGPATFASTTGDDINAPDLAPLRALHEIYHRDHAALLTAYQGRERARIAHEQWLRDHPPQPKDIILNFWDTGSGRPVRQPAIAPAQPTPPRRRRKPARRVAVPATSRRTAVSAVKKGEFTASRRSFIRSHITTYIFPILAAFFLATATEAPAMLDQNNNGISDLVEKTWHGGTMPAIPYDPEADLDGDGRDNLAEAVSGTDPFAGTAAAGGYLVPDYYTTPPVYGDTNGDGIDETITPQSFVINWPTVAGKSYQIQFNSGLSGEWFPSGEPLVGDGTVMGKTVTLTQPDGSIPDKLFFRIAVFDIDEDGDGLYNAEENLLGTSSLTPDSDHDGVTEYQECLTGTNPLSAADFDSDGMPDDLEKLVAGQLLAANPSAEYWSEFHAGLLTGNIDATHDYTGDGQPIGAFVSLYQKIANSRGLDGGNFGLESYWRANSLHGFPSADPDNHNFGIYSATVFEPEAPHDWNYYHEITTVEDLTHEYMKDQVASLAFIPEQRSGLLAMNARGSGGFVPCVAWYNSWGPNQDGNDECMGWLEQRKFRVVAPKANHDPIHEKYLIVTYNSNLIGNTEVLPREIVHVEPYEVKLPSGRLATPERVVEPQLVPGKMNMIQFNHISILSDLNNDGQIDAADASLRAAAESSTDPKIVERGTEFMFTNDSLSNGLWDAEDADPARPPTATTDDDVEQVEIIPGVDEGEIWLEHPAIAGMTFYKSRGCGPQDVVNLAGGNKLSISNDAPCPRKVFIRINQSLAFPAGVPQIEGDLVLKVKPKGADQAFAALKLKLIVVSHIGAAKYFQAARDYILENNTKLFTHDEYYDSSCYRIVAMREESTIMVTLDSYDHAASKPRFKGIDNVKANINADVIINGNQCFANNGIPFTDWPYPGGMTNQCDGRLMSHSQILRPPSNDTHHPLGGAIGRYVMWTVYKNRFAFGAGPIPEPATMDEGMGGLSTNYTLGVRQVSPNQAIGRWEATNPGNGVIFTATNYVEAGGKAKELAEDARNSGVKQLSGGDQDDWELLFLDGSSSVGLVLSNPSGVKKTVIKGAKHDGDNYYINTYLMFGCEAPRK